jgi:hypothetical protein
MQSEGLRLNGPKGRLEQRNNKLNKAEVRTNNENERTITRGQGRNREVGSEGRLWETCELMDKNYIEGRRRLVSWHNTAKPFGSSAQVNVVVVQGSTVFLPGEASFACLVWFKSTVKGKAMRVVMFALSSEESAESIVVASEPVSSLCLMGVLSFLRN